MHPNPTNTGLTTVTIFLLCSQQQSNKKTPPCLSVLITSNNCHALRGTKGLRASDTLKQALMLHGVGRLPACQSSLLQVSVESNNTAKKQAMPWILESLNAGNRMPWL